MRAALAQQAVDTAFINHVGKLFDRYCANIREEKGARVPSNSHARIAFQEEYALAITTHTEMSEHVNATSTK
jgi:hypothetical protein